MELIDTIVLNGKIGYVKTYDENIETIGVIQITEKVKFNGEIITEESGNFALTKRMEEKLEWGTNFASVRLLTGETPIDVLRVTETIIENYYGKVESDYYHRYTELSGYLYTKEKFNVGGHDLYNILSSNIGKYIHMEIDIYKA